jgi:hypothetical protein
LLCVPGCPEMATLLPQFLECWNLKACATMPSYSFFIFLSFFFFMILGFELRQCTLLGRQSAIWAMPPALFALVIFQRGSCFYAQPGLDDNSPVDTSGVAGVAGTYHYNLLALNHSPLNLHLPSS